MNNWELLLQDKILTEFKNTGVEFHGPHTVAVVQKMREIIAGAPYLNVDNEVLLIAAFAHDWGYAGLIDETKSVSMQQVVDVKKAHAEIGAQKIKNLLNDKLFDFLTPQQKERIAHLVLVHDLLSELKDTDELLLLEADTLGGLDVSLTKPSFDYESNLRYVEGVRIKRIPKFITEYSKNAVEELIKTRTEYYENLK